MGYRDQHLSDDALKGLMRPRLEELHAKTVPLETERPERTRERKEQRSSAKPKSDEPLKAKTEDTSKRDKDAALSEEMRDFLQSVLDHPDLTTTQRRDHLGLSTYKNDRIKKAVLEQGLAEEIAINLGHATRGNVKFLELTARGYEALGKESPASRPGNCSPEHWWYQRAIARWYDAQGITAKIEHCLNGKRADVAVMRRGKVTAIEVAITPKNEVVNVRKDLEAGFDAVLVACKNAKVKAAVEERLWPALDDAQRRKVKVTMLSRGQFLTGLGRTDRRTTTDLTDDQDSGSGEDDEQLPGT